MCLKVSPSEDKEQERMCQAIWRGGDGQEVGKSSVHQLLFTARIHAIETEPREYLEKLAMASQRSATVQRSAESQQSGKSSCPRDVMKKPPVHSAGSLCPGAERRVSWDTIVVRRVHELENLRLHLSGPRVLLWRCTNLWRCERLCSISHLLV